MVAYRFWVEWDDATGGRYFRDCATLAAAAKEAHYWTHDAVALANGPPPRYGIDETPQMEFDGSRWNWQSMPEVAD